MPKSIVPWGRRKNVSIQEAKGGTRVGASAPAQRQLPGEADDVAPDGSSVRVLCRLASASMAHFELRPKSISRPIMHRTVDEIWYVLGGRGRIWRQFAGHAAETALRPGLSLTLPVGTRFQFRSDGPEALTVLAVTAPPWPGDGEAVPASGPWAPSA